MRKLQLNDVSVPDLGGEYNSSMEYVLIMATGNVGFGRQEFEVFYAASDNAEAEELIPQVLDMVKINHGGLGELIRLEKRTTTVIKTFEE